MIYMIRHAHARTQVLTSVQILDSMSPTPATAAPTRISLGPALAPEGCAAELADGATRMS